MTQADHAALVANLRSVLVLLIESGDITPMGRRIVESILDRHADPDTLTPDTP